MVKTWLITGCSTGFGRALALAVLGRGDQLLATARDVNTLADLKAEYPERCQLATLDVTRPEEVQAAVAQVISSFGRLDVVVNNAGYGLLGSLEEVLEEQIRKNMEVNFFGPLSIMRAVLPQMRSQKSGLIINMSAAAAIANYAGFSVYGASKYALEGASEALAAEVKGLGIRVSCVQPGPFRTEFIARSLDRGAAALVDYEGSVGKFTQFLGKMDGHQPGSPAKAAEAILKLADSESPPFRFVLGKYAIEKAERVSKARLRDLETWKEVGLAADGAE